jgi:hypothetical protein
VKTVIQLVLNVKEKSLISVLNVNRIYFSTISLATRQDSVQIRLSLLFFLALNVTLLALIAMDPIQTSVWSVNRIYYSIIILVLKFVLTKLSKIKITVKNVMILVLTVLDQTSMNVQLVLQTSFIIIFHALKRVIALTKPLNNLQLVRIVMIIV